MIRFIFNIRWLWIAIAVIALMVACVDEQELYASEAHVSQLKAQLLHSQEVYQKVQRESFSLYKNWQACN